MVILVICFHRRILVGSIKVVPCIIIANHDPTKLLPERVMTSVVPTTAFIEFLVSLLILPVNIFSPSWELSWIKTDIRQVF